MTQNAYMGSGFDDFLEEEKILAEVNALAIKRVLVWQLCIKMTALKERLEDSEGDLE
jgi:antitoxin HicB